MAFIGAVETVAEISCGAALGGVADRLARPVSVAVTGRDGVGRGRVTTALRRRGITVCDDGEVCVLVVAEAVKPEDLALARAARRPVLLVLTKADLAGTGPEGPIAVARRRAEAVRRRTGIPAVAVVGLLAALHSPGDLDDDLVTALRRFVTEPPNVVSVDAFVDDPHSVARDVRARLLARLDRFGVAHAVLALKEGCDAETLPSHLARVGNVDEVTAALAVVAAPVRYRRLRGAIAELQALAGRVEDGAVSDLLAADVTAMATMSAAVDVVVAAGLSVDSGDTAAAHLDRARKWRRYGRGPVTALHRQCSADIVRGSLRLWDGQRA
ncbi:hypothetical protein CIW49_02915 [Mycolicibacterium sp. P1-18]|uniref:hypothetical protein n=1 Tax=Mycolicibacterium sp. P1-18 TaxID=2024615 RepID=UPI0011F2620A|nr:hypothetical protein [Mycolicibacterium sp. P1-18]KAA0102278.1 hypothetical protein CIW49_02915 [Mycolicibacterium sp. P1-18]